VGAVELNGDTVVPTFAGGAPVRADALVVRTGPRPVVPHCAAPRLGQQVLHSSDLMTYEVDHARREVLGIGNPANDPHHPHAARRHRQPITSRALCSPAAD